MLIRTLRPQYQLGLGMGRTVSANGVGKVKVTTQLHNGERVVCWMTDVLYVPKLTNNLLVFTQQLPKGIQYHSKTKTAVFGTRMGRSLVLDHPCVSSTSLIVKCNSYRLKTL